MGLAEICLQGVCLQRVCLKGVCFQRVCLKGVCLWKVCRSGSKRCLPSGGSASREVCLQGICLKRRSAPVGSASRGLPVCLWKVQGDLPQGRSVSRGTHHTGMHSWSICVSECYTRFLYCHSVLYFSASADDKTGSLYLQSFSKHLREDYMNKSFNDIFAMVKRSVQVFLQFY